MAKSWLIYKIMTFLELVRELRVQATKQTEFQTGTSPSRRGWGRTAVQHEGGGK